MSEAQALYMAVDEVAEMFGHACLPCQKLLYKDLTRFALERKQPTSEEVSEMILACCQECYIKMAQSLGSRVQHAEMDKKKAKAASTLEEEFASLCQTNQMPTNEVRGHNNAANAVHVKRLFARRARELGHSYPVIAKFLGLHYTTIMHLVKVDGTVEKSELSCKRR